jgi:membrane protease YdiL (CAAX protease family)
MVASIATRPLATMIATRIGPRSERKPTSLRPLLLGTRSILVHVTLALLALLIVVLGVLLFRAVTRERRDYARFKRLRSTMLRRRVFRRWAIESWLILGGLAGVVLLAAHPFVPPALESARRWGPLAAIPYGTDGAAAVVAGFAVGVVLVMVVPILLLRRQVDEVPAIGDIRALLPRNRGELPYGATLGLTAGIVEELLFRLALPALLFGVLKGFPGVGIPDAGALSFGIAALLFGALHLYQGPLGVLFAFILGLLFTLLYLVTGSILAPIALHVLIDLRSLVLIPIALGGAWKLGDTLAR